VLGVNNKHRLLNKTLNLQNIGNKLMTNTIKSRQVIYLTLAIAFAIAAIYHLAALLLPDSFPRSPVWRHILFILLNAIALLLTIRQWSWLWIPFSLLTIQQLSSHGLRAYNWWVLQQRIDTVSIFIILFMPFIAIYLFFDFKARLKTKKS
jgi:hypothetical protein